jgi:hypothetical protein
MSSQTRPSSRLRKLAVYCLFVLILVGLSASAERWQYSKQLNCRKQLDRRAQDICRSIERHLEFTWFGHAIISPGYHSTWNTVKNVWCEQHIEQKDAMVLRELAKTHDWRLESAAESLLRLLTGRDQYGQVEPENSIFNPANPAYLLKGGCPR